MTWVSNDLAKVESIVGGRLLDKVRQQVHCRFCRGKSCKHEDWSHAIKRRNTHVAIKGLHSNWVENWAIASQRPATVLIDKYEIIQQFKEFNVKAVFNLQETGEHPFCGPQGGLHPESGFTYNPEKDLMPHGISHYNFPWPDMCTPDYDIVLRTVQVMCDHVSKKERFLVHCHAGLGRTGLMIACWVMYEYKLTAEETIKRVRQQRPGSIQTARQLKFTMDFYSYLSGLAQIFPKEGENLKAYLSRQAKALHGQEGRALKYVPKIAHLITTKLLDEVDKEFSESGLTEKGGEICEMFVRLVSANTGRQPCALKKELSAKGWEVVAKAAPSQLLELLLDFFLSFEHPVLEVDPSLYSSFTATFEPHPPLPVASQVKPSVLLNPSPPSSLSLLLSPTSSRSSRILPPLGTSSMPRSLCVSPQPTEDNTHLSPIRKHEAILHRVSQRLAKEEGGTLASQILQKSTSPAAYHTTGVVLSALRLMSWDAPHAEQLEVMKAGVKLLTQQDSTDECAEFFLHAAKEWGDGYFTRTGLGSAGEDIREVYTRWVSELYAEQSSIETSPYTIEGIGTPPEMVKGALSLREKIACVYNTLLESNAEEAEEAPTPVCLTLKTEGTNVAASIDTTITVTPSRSESPIFSKKNRECVQSEVHTSLGLVSVREEETTSLLDSGASAPPEAVEASATE
eukprot:TRINITY_DN5540_c0_g1_i2.p1 TRINITY_DN5540_c0_g1~~TRINITY_DN5540_c0_g1_i2.p1  ORF type:complete len:682 (+),score=133.06 TRINITY_DN5540_c0_g1_i2:66-2111(+)